MAISPLGKRLKAKELSTFVPNAEAMLKADILEKTRTASYLETGSPAARL